MLFHAGYMRMVDGVYSTLPASLLLLLLQVFYDPGLADVLLDVEHELRGRGGFLPLMPLFPTATTTAAAAAASLPAAAAAAATSSASSAASGSRGPARQGSGTGGRVQKGGQKLDAALPWSQADRLARAWCSDRDKVLPSHPAAAGATGGTGAKVQSGTVRAGGR